jgi:2-haloalkanoic acid dehalogenase type II
MTSCTSEAFAPISVEAIAFDLLSALDSAVGLWERVARVPQIGQMWHANTLRKISTMGSYVPFELLVQTTAMETGLPREAGINLIEQWGAIRPWPDTPDVLGKLAGRRLAIVTNCSQQLAELAAGVNGTNFELVMSAERAGAYKPDPRAYRAALTALGLQPQQVLFVAGSMYDVSGAGSLGMPVYWANRYHAAVPAGAPPPLVDAPDLTGLPALLGISGD